MMRLGELVVVRSYSAGCVAGRADAVGALAGRMLQRIYCWVDSAGRRCNRSDTLAMTRVEPTHSGPRSQDMSVDAKIAGFGLLALAVIAAGATAIVYSMDPEANTPKFELLKALFSVSIVGLVGGLATFAFGTLQRDRDRRQDDARRDLEIRIDERRRRDEQVSAVLDDTLEHWLAVKRIRRELEAVTSTGSSTGGLSGGRRSFARRPGSGASITLDDYDRYLRELNKHQLAFERLKKIVPLLEEKIPHEPLPAGTSDSPEQLFHRIEDFLNDMVDEYQRFRYVVAKAGRLGFGRSGGALERSVRSDSTPAWARGARAEKDVA
jgi:hypothetical protein